MMPAVDDPKPKCRLEIQQSQWGAFEAAAHRDFEDHVIEHVNICFPARCAALGVDGTRAMVLQGISRAETHELSSERDICKYVSLTFIHGLAFEDDPAYTWAARLLRDASHPPTDRIDRVYAGSIDLAENGGAG